MKMTLALPVLMALSSQMVMAQDGKIDIGVKSSRLLKSNLNTYGLHMSFQGDDGTYLPVKLEIGKDVLNFAAGIGVKTNEDFSEILTYSVAGAINYLSFSENLKSVMPKDKERITLLLQQEVSFRLAERLAVGVNLDLDVLNVFRRDRANNLYCEEDLFELGYKPSPENGPGYYWSPEGQLTEAEVSFKSKKEWQDNFDSVKKSSASGIGLTLKISLGKVK